MRAGSQGVVQRFTEDGEDVSEQVLARDYIDVRGHWGWVDAMRWRWRQYSLIGVNSMTHVNMNSICIIPVGDAPAFASCAF
jgi:hypothetical protein